MAVEIPVYVDIHGAFEQAAREIPKEMPKLEKAISSQALKVQFNGLNMRSLLTEDLPMNELKGALKAIRKEFESVTSGAVKARKGMNVDNLIKSYSLLEQRINGSFNKFTPLIMKTEAAIGKVNVKVSKLQATLSASAFGSDAFNKTNYELKLQQKRLAELNVQLLKYKAGIDSTNESVSRQNSLFKSMAGYFSGIYAVHTVTRFVKQVRDVTGELEYQRVALGHLLGDMQVGNELFAKTVEAAKESPFRITQLVTYTKQLAAYRIEQENLFDTTQRLADISAGLGVDMNRLILAYGQVRAASVLRGQELRQFTEAGIPLVDMLAEKFRKLGREGTTTADVFKLISERAVPFQYIKEIFEELTSAGGMFYKMQEEQAKTLKGRWEKLKDAYDQALMSIGDDSTFREWNDTVLRVLNGVAKGLKGIVRFVNAATVSWVAYKAVTAIVKSDGVKLAATFAKEYKAAGLMTVVVNGLTNAWKRFLVVLKTNWVGLALSAIAGVITFLTTFKSKTKEATQELSDMQRAINGMKEANETLKYSKELISAYGELAGKTSRTSTENQRLATTMEELRRLYPDLTSKMDDENVTLEKKVELLNDAANAAHEMAVEEAKERLKTQEGVIRGLEDDLATAEAKKNAAEARRRAAEEREKAGPVAASEQYGPGTFQTAKDLARATMEAASAAKVAEAEYDKIAEDLANARKEEEALKKMVYPEEQTKSMQQWAKELKRVQDEMTKNKVGAVKVFEDSDLEKFTSLYDFSKKLKKEWTDLKESIAGMEKEYSAMTDKTTEAAKALFGEISQKKDTFAIAETWRVLLGLIFNKPDGSDKRLSNLKKDISEITNAYKKFLELRKYMGEDQALSQIGLLFPQLSGWKPTYEKTIEKLSKMRQDVAAKLAKSPKDKTLLEMQRTLDTEISNLKFENLKKTIDDGLKKVSDELKRSETARNFYRNILDLTGDEQLAATLSVSVYGDVGAEFKDRMQKQLSDALNFLDANEYVSLDDKIRDAFETGDYKYLMKNLDKVPMALRNTVKTVASDTERYNAEIANSYAKLLEKFGNIEDKRKKIHKDAAGDIDKINSGLQKELAGLEARGASDEQIQGAKDRADRAIAAVKRKEKEEIFALSEDYRLFFNTVSILSTKAAKDVAIKQRKILSEQFANGEIDLVKYKRQLKEINEQLRKYENGVEKASRVLGGDIFGALADQVKEYAEDIIGLSDTIETKNGIWAPNDDARKFLNNVNRVLNAGNFAAIFKKGAKIDVEHEVNVKAAEAFNKAKSEGKSDAGAEEAASAVAKKVLSEYGIQMEAAVSEFGDVVAALIVALKQIKSFADFAERYDEDMKRSTGNSSFGQGGTLVVNGVEMESNLSAANMSDILGGITGAYEKFKSLDLWGGIQELVDGFSMYRSKVNEANWAIKVQDEQLKDLQHAYSRLEAAEKKAFGSDYVAIYSQQVANLTAQAEAYRAQAAAERSKGKKADEFKARDYENEAQKILDTIEDAQSKLSEFFSGTDLTSAAKDFANAWIEAYKEFGSTTDALSQKFEDMIQNMVVNSMAAQIVKNQLKDVFDMIDAAAEGGISIPEAAAIANKTKETVGTLNLGLTNLMNALGGAGINIRQMGTGLTGISRDIQGASEESILGLAAGVNTQNFYMAQINANVLAILERMGGANTASTPDGETIPGYQEQMLQYAAYMPMLHNETYAIRTMLERVIKPNGVSATHYVAIK